MNRGAGLVSCGALALTLTAWWARLVSNVGDYREQFFTADLLYWPAVIEDVLVRGHPFWGTWQLTPAPYFFPDAVIALLARGVFATVEARQYASVMLQVLLLAAAVGFLVSAIGKGLWPLGPAITSVAVALALGEWAPFQFLLFPSFHVGAVIVTFTALGIAARQPAGRAWWVALGLVLFAGAASDVLVLVFVLGGVAVVVLGAVRRWGVAGAGMVGRPAAGMAVSVVLGAVAARLLPFADRESHSTRFATLFQTLATAASQAMGFGIVFWGALLLGLPSLLFVALRARGLAARALSLALLGGTFATIAAVLVSGNLAGGEWHRYLLTPLLGCLVGLVLALPGENVQRTSAAAAALLSAFATAVVTPWAWSFEAPPSRLRAQAACLDALAQREGATGVVTDYWRAKPLALFSTSGASPATFMPQLDRPQVWITSRAWYRPASGFAFVVDQGLEAGALARQLGEGETIEACGDWPVHVYRGEARVRLTALVEERVSAELGPRAR